MSLHSGSEKIYSLSLRGSTTDYESHIVPIQLETRALCAGDETPSKQHSKPADMNDGLS